MRRPSLTAWSLAAAAAVALLLPALASPAGVGLATNVLIAALFALAFNLLVGQAGLLSFGHAAYFATGAFATIHAMIAVERRDLWLPTPALPLVGALAGLLAGIVCGFFAAKRSGVYFAMVTLAIAEVLFALAPNLAGVFGGETGLSSMRQPWLGIGFGSPRDVYYLVLAWATAAAACLYLYTRTPFGRLTVALRENERRIAFLGYDQHLSKVVVFAVSAGFSGLAGGLLAFSNESANYVLFGSGYSSAVVLQTFVGGSTVFLGPAIGAAVLTLFGSLASDATRLWLLYQGVLFVGVMLFLPQGFVGALVERAAARELRAGRIATGVAGLAGLGAGFVFLCESAAVLCSRDYAAQVDRAGALLPVHLFGRDWDPTSPATWLVPLGLFALGALALRARRLAAEAVAAGGVAQAGEGARS